MLLPLFVLYAVTDLFVTSESIQDTPENILGEKRIKPNEGALSFYASINNKLPPANNTLYEKDVNPLRVPEKFYEQPKQKSKVIKSPKRTIQKIIKNGKTRSKKFYVHPVTRKTQTVTLEDVKIQYSNTQRNIQQNVKPTEHNHKRKPKKNLRLARYPMPFHNFQTKINTHKRNRRHVGRNDVFILKDLDEMEFLSKENDYDVVKTHVQNHW
ncbi:uncharacterized protein LOC123877573 [Maniola jurtina]|uniref:uncharacterized protein LOC123877573 n=1 Tax=Maniola jurtina TaxID=191418 RepID=UPI001E689141|nr:uncharacterized protein LOC123877573 [Maniola jurtina]